MCQLIRSLQQPCAVSTIFKTTLQMRKLGLVITNTISKAYNIQRAEPKFTILIQVYLTLKFIFLSFNLS